MTIFLSTWYHNEIGLTIKPNTTERVVFARTRTGPEATVNTVYESVPSGTSTVTLFIKAEPAKYSLGYAIGKGQAKYIASLESKWLQAFVKGCVYTQCRAIGTPEADLCYY